MRLILLVLMLFSCVNQLSAQREPNWEPTGEWPFVHRRFLPANVYTGFFSLKKTVVPCNIHLGNQTLWYVQNDTLMERFHAHMEECSNLATHGGPVAATKKTYNPG